MASSFIRHLARPVLTKSKGKKKETNKEMVFLYIYNSGFLSVATQRNIPLNSILFHRTQATTPPTTTPNVPARKYFIKDFLFTKSLFII